MGGTPLYCVNKNCTVFDLIIRINVFNYFHNSCMAIDVKTTY